MLKIIFSLIWNKASKKEWQLQIGAHFLKKGAGYKLGQILYEKKVMHHEGDKLIKVKVVDDLTYDFKTNKVHLRSSNRLVKPSDLKKV